LSGKAGSCWHHALFPPYTGGASACLQAVPESSRTPIPPPPRGDNDELPRSSPTAHSQAPGSDAVTTVRHCYPQIGERTEKKDRAPFFDSHRPGGP